jgi:hypothetical protein
MFEVVAEPADEAVPPDTAALDRSAQVQHNVLAALAGCRNHREWFASFALPYLGESPIEIGSGMGNYALNWIPFVRQLTVTEADPILLAELSRAMSEYPNVTVNELTLPTDDRAAYSSVVCYNVLEHIEDDIAALRSMAGLVHSGGYIVLICPAFPFAMSPIDIATGHLRRYTKRSMCQALEEAHLEPILVRYVNSVGLILYYAFTSLLKKAPSQGGVLTLYDRFIVPVIRLIERLIRSPPFGQSVLAVARVPEKL